MPNDKSQLDIYQIEQETVVAEICKSLAPEQKAQLTALFETVTAGTPTTDNITELSEAIIGYIIRKQNSNPKVLHYESLSLSSNTIRGYTLVLYEACSRPRSPIATILQERTTQNPRTGMNISHILFAYDRNSIYAVCSGAGWQVVTPYANSQFGLNVLARLIPQNEEAISSARYRGFAGTVAAQDTSYRKKVRTSEVSEFGRCSKISLDRLLPILSVKHSELMLLRVENILAPISKTLLKFEKAYHCQSLATSLIKSQTY